MTVWSLVRFRILCGLLSLQGVHSSRSLTAGRLESLRMPAARGLRSSFNTNEAVSYPSGQVVGRGARLMARFAVPPRQLDRAYRRRSRKPRVGGERKCACLVYASTEVKSVTWGNGGQVRSDRLASAQSRAVDKH